jgi:hypothetical protein
MMHELDRLTSKQENGEFILSQIKANLDRPFIMLQEYIPGYTLEYISGERAMKCFDEHAPDAQDRLLILGRIIATDIVVNNPDRIPSIQSKNGNSSNVMFEVHLDEMIDKEKYFDDSYADMNFAEVVAIDNKCYSITLPESQEIYLRNVETFLTSMFEDL